MNETPGPRVIVGFDGSLAAVAALDAGTLLLPRAHAWITNLWTPPFASETVRRRLWRGTAAVEEFVAAIEREGQWTAEQTAATGVTLACRAGWIAEPLVQRSDGGEGLAFTSLAEKWDADLVLVGSRGLGGARAMLGSVSDMVVHYTPRPVLVVPQSMLMAEHAAVAEGPVLLGWDGSTGARTAYTVATRLFPSRDVIVASVEDGNDAAPDPDREVVALPMVDGRLQPAHGVAEALANCADQRKAALLVMGSRGRSALSEIVLGSVAMATLHRAHRPVLIVPPALEG